MLKLFKDSLKKTNDCIILATPLIIFLSILGWYCNYAIVSIDNLPKLILAIITLLIMASGFFAAWVYMTKKTLQLSNQVFIFDKDRAKAFWELLLSLPKGIGRLFLPFLGVISLSAVVSAIAVFIITYLVTTYLGTISLDLLNADNVMLSSKELFDEISNLSLNEIITINCWYLLIICYTFMAQFLTILWIPEIVYSERNPFKALISAFKKLLISFPKSLLLYIYINFLVLIMTVLNTLLMFNPIAYFVVLIIYYYLIVYIIVLLFTYYQQTFLKDE